MYKRQHDLFSSEAELQAEGKPAAAEKWLREHDLVYDGVLEAPKGETPEDWEPVELPLFRSTKFGDDQDRPIKKSDGSWTYFGADLAYQYQKAQDADELIDIWGADHAGTVKRIKAAVAALTGGAKKFDVKLVQMVRLLKNGEPFKMSKRAGNFVTLADIAVSYTHLDVYKRQVYQLADFDVVATRRDAGPARTVELPYFATVVQGGTAVVAKRLGTVTVSFPEGQTRGSGHAQAAAYVDRAAATLPADVQERINRKRRAGDADAAIDPLSCLLYTSRCV